MVPSKCYRVKILNKTKKINKRLLFDVGHLAESPIASVVVLLVEDALVYTPPS